MLCVPNQTPGNTATMAFRWSLHARRVACRQTIPHRMHYVWPRGVGVAKLVKDQGLRGGTEWPVSNTYWVALDL